MCVDVKKAITLIPTYYYDLLVGHFAYIGTTDIRIHISPDATR